MSEIAAAAEKVSGSDVQPDIEAVVQDIGSRYRIVGQPLLVSEFFTPDGERLWHDRLRSSRRDSFAHDERILVIQDTEDHYAYHDQPGVCLQWLQDTLQQIDISNYFVLVVTGNPEIAEEIRMVHESSRDDVPLRYHMVDWPYHRQDQARDSFCIVPWTHIFVDYDGTQSACCLAVHDKPLGDLKTQAVTDIINNDRYRSMRLAMLQNRSIPDCHRCYQQERRGITSGRQRHNRRYLDRISALRDSTEPDGSIRDFRALTVDLRLNNVCNLKCRTCSGAYSSKIAQEEKLLFGNTTNVDRMLTKAQRQSILEHALAHMDHVEHVYFAGGEPLIMDEHYAIMNRLLERGRTDVAIFYNTNFTNLVHRGQDVLELWKKFSKIKIGASLDGHGTVFEYVRHGAQWQHIVSNVDRLKQHCPAVEFTVTSTISILSVRSVIELQRQWHESGVLDISRFVINPVGGSPDLHALEVLPASFKQQVAHMIQEHCDWLAQQGADDLRQSWIKILDMMMSADRSYLLPFLQKLTQQRDQHRGEKLAAVLPEYLTLFDHAES
jgi:sulfatase maturation enzyme AslB (radical SAM superfamily)